VYNNGLVRQCIAALGLPVVPKNIFGMRLDDLVMSGSLPEQVVPVPDPRQAERASSFEAVNLGGVGAHALYRTIAPLKHEFPISTHAVRTSAPTPETR
jgi:hypothetical protein